MMSNLAALGGNFSLANGALGAYLTKAGATRSMAKFLLSIVDGWSFGSMLKLARSMPCLPFTM